MTFTLPMHLVSFSDEFEELQHRNVTSDNAIPTRQRLLANTRYLDLHNEMKSMLSGLELQKALRDFGPPSPSKIVAMLDKSEIVTVEGLRALIIDELTACQADLNGSETTSKDAFYKDFQKGEHLREVPAALRIADRFRLLLKGQGIVVEPEKTDASGHEMRHNFYKDDRQCSKTASG